MSLMISECFSIRSVVLKKDVKLKPTARVWLPSMTKETIDGSGKIYEMSSLSSSMCKST